jgi:hypothetical protein
MIPFQACVLGDFFCVFQLRRFTKSCPYLPFFLVEERGRIDTPLVY